MIKWTSIHTRPIHTCLATHLLAETFNASAFKTCFTICRMTLVHAYAGLARLTSAGATARNTLPCLYLYSKTAY